MRFSLRKCWELVKRANSRRNIQSIHWDKSMDATSSWESWVSIVMKGHSTLSKMWVPTTGKSSYKNWKSRATSLSYTTSTKVAMKTMSALYAFVRKSTPWLNPATTYVFATIAVIMSRKVAILVQSAELISRLSRRSSLVSEMMLYLCVFLVKADRYLGYIGRYNEEEMEEPKILLRIRW